MIVTLQVKLISGAYATDPWEAVIAVDESSTLQDLHFIIQQAVDFDNDHLYEFYIARTPRSGDRTRFDEEDGEIFTRTIESLFPLPKDRRLYYRFDYGDEWRFQVARTRAKPVEPQPRVAYPRLVSETGTKPVQYPDLDE